MKCKTAIAVVILSILVISLFYCVVNAQSAKLLSKGDTFTYDRFYLWESNDPIIAPPANVYFFTNNNSVITVKIINISIQMVNTEITTKFQNGTETIENVSINIKIGENTPNAFFMGETTLNKNINIIQTNATSINCTQTRTFNGVEKEVNIFSSTGSGQAIFKWGSGLFDNYLYPTSDLREICYDAKTGMFLEYHTNLFMHNQNNINLNATIEQSIIIRTDSIGDLPTPSVPEFSWLTILPILLTTSIALAIVRKRLQRNV